MYYEEKIINGVMHYRTTQSGEFFNMSPEMMTARINNLTREVEMWKYILETAEQAQ